jgi:DNA end-binding protein Ku
MFEDHYESALVDLINQKRAGKPITPKERPKGENVVDLMEALRRSVGGTAETNASKKPAKKSRKASSGQKEILMPIAGRQEAGEGSGGQEARRQAAAEVRLVTDGRDVTYGEAALRVR